MDIDLNKFTAEKWEPREWMRTPFNFNDKTIATSGVVLIACNSEQQYPTIPIDDNLIQKVFKRTGFKKLGRLNFPEKIKCRRCKGSGKSEYVECKSCDGTGDTNAYFECNECRGDGVVLRYGRKTCEVCDGSKFVYPEIETTRNYEIKHTIEIETINFNPKYFELINYKDLQVSIDKVNRMCFFKIGKKYRGVIAGLRESKL